MAFAYQDKEVRHNVNFSMKKNTMAALVGPSGGEKQRISIARCILRRVSMKQLQKRMPAGLNTLSVMRASESCKDIL